MKNIIIALLVTLNLKANYPTAVENKNLKEKIENDPSRLIKNTKYTSFAIDSEVYGRLLGLHDFYHGIGYWLQARSEFRISDNFRINSRSIFYSGSISGGYTNPLGNYHLFSFHAQKENFIFKGMMEARAMDLGKKTIGNGLFIQDQETAGLELRWYNDQHSFTYFGDGTGGLILNADLQSFEVKVYKNLLSFGTIIWPKEEEVGFEIPGIYYFLTSNFKIINEKSKLMFEAGIKDKKVAYLAGVKLDFEKDRFKLNTKIQTRFYQDRIAKGFLGEIAPNYIAYEQYSKEFAGAFNAFTKDDDLFIHSLILNFKFKFNKQFELSSMNELGIFDYKSRVNRKFYFYRHGIMYDYSHYFKIKNVKSELYASNKVLTNSFDRPPRGNFDFNQNSEIFKEQFFVGFDVKFYL